MKAADHIKTPRQYIESLPEDRKEAVRILDQAIREAAPELKPEIGHGMLGYGPYSYKYADGKEGRSWTICLASQKQHLSLYLGCEDEDGISSVAKNKDRLGKVSVGKCCVRFKKLADLNIDVAMELVQLAARRASAPAP